MLTIPSFKKIKRYFRLLRQNKIFIDSGLAGAEIRAHPYNVDARQISNYAAAVSDMSDIYYSDRKSGVVCAHPVFPVRISWGIISRLADYLDMEIPFSMTDHFVQVSEYIEYTRPIRPDDKLVISGKIFALLPHTRGTKLVLKFEAVDSSDQPVYSEYVGALLFGFKCADPGKQLGHLPSAETTPGTTPVWAENITLARSSPYIYDGCTDISYPVHTNKRFARSMGLPDIIMQGTATLAMGISAVIQKELDGDARPVQIISGKFTDIVVPPNQLSVRLLKKTDNEFFFGVSEQSGKEVIRGGYIRSRKA